MSISKDQAVVLAHEHFTQATTRTIAKYFEECTPADSLPSSGTVYWTHDGKESDYWYIPSPNLDEKDYLHTGGTTHYLVISKRTGEISGITIHGE